MFIASVLIHTRTTRKIAKSGEEVGESQAGLNFNLPQNIFCQPPASTIAHNFFTPLDSRAAARHNLIEVRN